MDEFEAVARVYLKYALLVVGGLFLLSLVIFGVAYADDRQRILSMAEDALRASNPSLDLTIKGYVIKSEADFACGVIYMEVRNRGQHVRWMHRDHKIELHKHLDNEDGVTPPGTWLFDKRWVDNGCGS